MWSWIIYILIGALAGWVASVIIKGGGFGFLLNALIGIAGGILGGWLFSLLGINAKITMGGLGASIIGAMLLLGIAAFFRKKAGVLNN